MARSYFFSTPICRASTVLPSGSLQVIAAFSSLSLVTIRPSAATIVPRAASLPSHSTRTVLFAGFATTLLKALTTVGSFRSVTLCAEAAVVKIHRIAAARQGADRGDQ